jgi:hypothetical protein
MERLVKLPSRFGLINLVNCKWNKAELLEMANLLNSNTNGWGKGCEIVNRHLAQKMGYGYKYPEELLDFELQRLLRHIQISTSVPIDGWAGKGEWKWTELSPRIGYSSFMDRTGNPYIWTVCLTFETDIVMDNFLHWAFTNNRILLGGMRLGKPRLSSASGSFYLHEIKLWFSSTKQAQSLLTLLVNKEKALQEEYVLKQSVPLHTSVKSFPSSAITGEGQEILESDYINELISLHEGDISSDEFLSILQEDGLSYDFNSKQFIIL